MVREVPPSKVDPFISKVSLSNFKSVVDQQEVDLGRLTLLVGENSSGKSSILQVLRLLQQSVLSSQTPLEPVVDSRFPLNGRHIRVGTIEDIRNERKDKKSNVSFGVEIVEENSTINWDIDINDTVDGAPSFTYIKQLKIMQSDEEQSQLTVEVDLKGRHGKTIDVKYIAENRFGISRYRGIHRFGIPHSKVIALSPKGTYLSKSSNVKISGLMLDGSVPLGVTVREEANRVFAEVWLDSIIRSILIGGRKDKEDKPELSDKDSLVCHAFDRFSKLLDDHELDKISYSHLRSGLPALRPALKEELKSGIEHEKIIKEISKKISKIEKIGKKTIQILYELPSLYLIRSRFDRVRYLGPLREAPRLLMPSSSNLDDVGEKGEYTAAVLLYQGKRQQDFPVPSSSFSESDNYAVADQYSKERVSLLEAIERWCSVLRLVEEIVTTDRAALGLTMQVKPHGTGSSLPLTSVGVGVSQLLPVLTLCLSARPGDVILLEQPELHLHPAMQQRLADFLICMSHSGRQLIVETHSEYILSRLRRRIAEESDDKVMNLVQVIFAERNEETGVTKYDPLDFTTYGDLKRWPKGFFDQAAEDEREIIRGALKKQKARKPA